MAAPSEIESGSSKDSNQLFSAERRMSDDSQLQDPCQICVNSASRYTCPQCNIRYCSVDCYRSQKHGVCSEAFYKECVIQGLKDQTTRPEERAKVLEMLQRLDDEVPALDSDDEDVEDLQDRISDLDLDRDSDEVWKRLTEREREDFKSMLRDGRLGNLVETWTPWWAHRDTRLVEEVDTEKEVKPSKVPAPLTTIPDIHSLLKNKKPSSDIKNNVLNVLYSYAYVVRLYNGGHWDNQHHSLNELMEICDVLRSNISYTSPKDAVHACLLILNQEKEQESNRHFHISVIQDEKDHESSNRHFHISVIQDVCNIIHGPSSTSPLTYTIASLSDIHRLMAATIKAKKKGKRKGDNSTTTQTTFSAQKKVEFMLSWCQRYGHALQSTLAELNLEICALSSDLASVETTKQQIESKWKKDEEDDLKPPLIQEIS